jgi:hypothetical protein
MQPFILASDSMALHGDDTLVLEIPATLSSKEALLSWFARELKFPEYFGANWDAFDEALRDLSWIQQRRVVLAHQGVPLADQSKDRRIYLETIMNAVRDWKSDASHELIVAFPVASEIELRAVMRDRKPSVL